MKYHAITGRVIVKMQGTDIHDISATVIEIVDDGGGPYVRLTQPEEAAGSGVSIHGAEWPLIRDAVQKLLEVEK